ncbi:MAG: hypothetical protein HKN13_10720 [Rhodothermales bacterium]|nr:hypothetical protein [Rhodothermales bacterium]
MRNHHTFTLLAALAVTTIVPRSAFGQLVAHGARSIGLGGANPASVVGQYAINLNPSRLAGANSGFRKVGLSIGGVSVFAGGPLVQFRAYNDAFTSGSVITHEEGRAIVEDWFGSASLQSIKRIGIQAETVPVAFAMHLGKMGIGVGLRTRTYGQLGINGGWVDLLVVGTGEERTLPLNADMSMTNMTDISVGIARSFMGGRLSVGITPRLVLGSDYSRMQLESAATVTSTSVVHDFEYQIQSAGSVNRDVLSQVNLFQSDPFGSGTFSPNPFESAGKGFGLDFGVRYAYSNRIELAASVTDLGSITWSGDAATYSPVNDQFMFDGIELDLSELQDDFDNDFGEYLSSQLDSLARTAYEETESVPGSFKTSLPTRLHVGSSWSMLRGKALLTAGGSVAANTVPGNVSRNPSMHVGAEYQIGGRFFSMPVRGGVQIGGSGAMTLAFGFGVHIGPYRMDLGVAATPTTTTGGQGGRYIVGASLLNVMF